MHKFSFLLDGLVMDLHIIKNTKNKYSIIPKFVGWPDFIEHEVNLIVNHIIKSNSKSDVRQGLGLGNDPNRLNILYRPEEFGEFPILVKLEIP